MHTIAIALFDDVPTYELAVPCEVFDTDRSYLGVEWYRCVRCATRPGPVRASGGFTVRADHDLAELTRADTVIVPACAGIDAPPEPELVEAVRAAHGRGARIASICSGAFVLAEAGLLDGRQATTHWMYADALARRYPAVKVDPAVLYVDEGDILTSAGTAAGMDMCLHIVRTDHGAEVANALARRLVVPPHREGGQAQYVELPVPPPYGDSLSPVLDWALEHLDEPLTVDMLARRARTSARTFARRFRATTGTTPAQWLIQQRIRLAQRLLETTDEPVERIAARCGFGTSASLRQHVTRSLGVSPQAYRKTFRVTSSLTA